MNKVCSDKLSGFIRISFLHNSFLFFSNVKLLSTVTSRNLSLEFPSMEGLLIIMDFKLKGDQNKLHFDWFALKLFWQNQSKRLSIGISRSDMASKNVFTQLYRLVSSV